MAIVKPPISDPFASNPTTQANPVLFAAPSFMFDGYTAPGGNPEIPALGHHNFLFWYGMQSGRYHQSRGLPEWDTDETEYTAPALVTFAGIPWILFGAATPGTDPASDPTNWMPFGSIGPWGFSTTNTVISADTDLILGHAYYRNLTINAGKTLYMLHPGSIYVSGKLTIASGGKIVFGRGTSSSNAGTNASASTRGLGAVGWNGDTFGQLLGGGSGGNGGDDSHLTPGDGAPVGAGPFAGALGGSGGAGGNGAHAGGAAGIANSFFGGSPTNDSLAQSLLQIIMNGGWGFARGGTETARAPIPFGIEGGGGGGGGGGPTGPGNSAGGGGGAGGAVGLVYARNAEIAADGCIQAPGGNGGNAFAGTVAAGGGSAGGGGFVGLVYGAKSGPPLTAANCCPGGTGGTGANGGAAGANGAVGNVREYQIGM